MKQRTEKAIFSRRLPLIWQQPISINADILNFGLLGCTVMAVPSDSWPVGGTTRRARLHPRRLRAAQACIFRAHTPTDDQRYHGFWFFIGWCVRWTVEAGTPYALIVESS